jgi:hypothetical protein
VVVARATIPKHVVAEATNYAPSEPPGLVDRTVSMSDNRAMTRPGWRELLLQIVAVAAFPRLAPTAWARRSPRAVVARIAFGTALGFAIRTSFALCHEWMTEVRDELRRQFGREPTETEVMKRIRAAHGR